uniref:Uncharacterized protein isoform X1 n=1 Tax=Nicotiana tabacum TaxID=4097 RepID=A0A1S3ZW25_TOBAC|nr:PREDICTED: uncharacterized protein LOC107791053 isoform X1 [Nicotiana tabacum]XP_016468529.1 PREDICTED: uncharacterized protein LOC107791053 isoform X1 [Nicotiana tabacum]
MSVDTEFPYGPSILTDEKLPEVGNPAVPCQNSSSNDAVVFTKEASNCPADNGQMKRNTASEITGIEEMSGESGGSDKSNDDEKLRKGSVEAAKADGNYEDKLQSDQSENAENAESDGQGAPSMVTEIKGVNEIGGDFKGDVQLVCEESADTEKVESSCQTAASTVIEIKAVEEIKGESTSSRKNDKSVDAEEANINSSMSVNPVIETVGMEEMRGESSDPRRSNDGSSEESGEAEKADSSCQRAPHSTMEMTTLEKMGCLSSSVENSSGDITGQEPPNTVTKIKGTNEIGGDSNGDVKLVCEESADTEKVESNGQASHSTVTEITAIEEIRPESNGLSKIDESVDAEKAGSNNSLATDIVTEINKLEDESNGAEKINNVSEITGIQVESNGAEEISDDKVACQESTNTEKGDDSNGDVKLVCEESSDTEKVESNSQAAPSTVTEITAIEEIRPESNGLSKIDESVDAEKAGSNNSLTTDIVTEMNGLEDESNGAEKINNVSEITGIQVESNGAEEISDDKLACQESTNSEKGGDSDGDVTLVCEESSDTEKVESNGQAAPSTVTEITAIEETRPESNGLSKIDESVDAEKAGSNSSLATDIVTEIKGLEDESNGAEKINNVSEIIGIQVESNGAEEINDDKLACQESTNAENADSLIQSVSNVVSEIKRTEDIEGESDVADKRTDGNSTCGERKDAEAMNSGTPVHTGIDAVTFGKESTNNPVNDVQNVHNTVLETICNEEIGSASNGDKDIDDKVMRQRDEESERLQSDGLASEGMSSDAEFSRGLCILADARLSEVENSFTSISRDMSSNDAIAWGNETCDSCISHGQSPVDMVQETNGKEVERESNGVDRSGDDKLICEEIEDGKRFNCSSLAAEGMSCNTEFSQGLSTFADSNFSEVGNYCASSTKDMSSNDAFGVKNEALYSCADDSQLGPNLVKEGSGVENLEGVLNSVDNSINNRILYENCGDTEKSHIGSDNVGVHGDAEVPIDQSVLADVKLCEVGDSYASSIKDVCHDVVSGNSLNEPVHESKMVPMPYTAIEFTGIKKEGESSVAGQNSDDKFLHESEDAEKPPSTNIDERMSGLELSVAGNTSAPSTRDVPSNDAVTFGSETLTCPIEIDQESANMSIEIAGAEEMGGGSDRSNDDKLMCEQIGDAEISSTNDVLTTSAECSSVEAVAVRDMNVSAAKGFNFLIRMPRFDDEKLRERIRVAELNVDEKTQHRDAFRQKIRNKRVNCQTHGAEFEAAKTQERDARKQVRTKRAEISTLQDVIDKAKNAVAIDEIDNRICNMEHIIGHETLPLKEEKLLIREIKQLKQLRGQISSNIGRQDEVQKALDERVVNEEQLRILKKELDNLKVKASKAETIAMAASRKYEDESRKLKELQAQFKAADDIRQEAYEELRNLKKGFYEKNVHFRTYKDEATLASDHARNREMEALNHLCVNQVERYMELWNKNDEFRKEYIRCNTRSTLRRFGTLDGRTLGPDEEPTVLPSYVEQRAARLVTRVDKVNFVSQAPVSQQENQAVVLKDESKDDNIKLQAAEKMNPIEKTKEAPKPIQREMSVVDEPKEAEQLQTAQELEAARKEEEQRKREEAARLKEQRRLEEIAKAKEALERKRRNAEKAQLRAELRAQKEEEQRLKEKEKRLRKKERKKGAVGETETETNDGETALISTSLRETVKEPEATENPQANTKKPQKPSQYTKQIKTKSTIPPPLRNRSRRKLQQWIWLTISCLVVIALFCLGNIGFFTNLKQRGSPRF